MKTTTKEKKLATIKNFAIGGLAGCIATTAILPIDYIKVHRQVMGETGVGKMSTVEFAKLTLKQKGFTEFYKGLDSALFRQVLYTTCRLGLYRTFSESEKQRTGKDVIDFSKKMEYSLISGAIGSTIGNPADITLVRVQTDSMLPPESRRNYKGVSDAFVRMYREEGLTSFWRGCTPTILRACAMNVGMLVPYDSAKEGLDKAFGKSTWNQFSASFIAAVVACVVSLPFDNVKTKYQRMAPGVDGKLPYSSFSDCVQKSIKREGLLGLYIGFPVFVMRVAPHVIITLLTQEYLHHLFTKEAS
jgi:solute carrier family 25 oxoglutarate transporter 11